MRFITILSVVILALQSCESKTDALSILSARQKLIDSLWAIEVSDSLKATNSHYLESYGLLQSGETIRLDNLKIEDWPEPILSFHDLLFTQEGQLIAAQDAVLGHAESCLSRHYFHNDSHTIARLISNWYYDDSTKLIVEHKSVQFFGRDMSSLGTDSVLQDTDGNTITHTVGHPRLDGHSLPIYSTSPEFLKINKITL